MAPSTYYDTKTRAPSARACRDAVLGPALTQLSGQDGAAQHFDSSGNIVSVCSQYRETSLHFDCLTGNHDATPRLPVPKAQSGDVPRHGRLSPRHPTSPDPPRSADGRLGPLEPGAVHVR